MEYDILLKEKTTESRSGNVTISTREVAEAYDGGDHRNNTLIRQAAGIAIKLHPLTIKAIGETVNHLCTDVIVRSKELNRLELQTEEELLEHEDFRLFKSFVCFGSLRSATNFLKEVGSGDSTAQTNTIYRIRHYCELHNYKPVQSKAVSEQF